MNSDTFLHDFLEKIPFSFDFSIMSIQNKACCFTKLIFTDLLESYFSGIILSTQKHHHTAVKVHREKSFILKEENNL